MHRPLDWLVVAMSLAFLGLGRLMTAPVESRIEAPVPALDVPYAPVLNAQVLPFEPSGVFAVPASLRSERTLEFGYVRLDAAAHN
jgi:hypothetical protein